MTRTIKCGTRRGTVCVPASKSLAHRILICAALGDRPVQLRLRGHSGDIFATAKCLNALGADIDVTDDGFSVQPIAKVPAGVCRLDCGESGSTLRFLLPVTGALGAKAVFHCAGRLAERPISPLTDELNRHGMTIRTHGDRITCEGQLCGGDFSLPGNISSQFISGLLLALPHLARNSTLRVRDRTESAGYLALTKEVLSKSQIAFTAADNFYRISGAQRCRLPETVTPEGDYSGAAPFLCMGALSHGGVRVTGLCPDSAQGDRAILEILAQMGAKVLVTGDTVTVLRGTLRGITVDAAQTPDLIPPLCALAAAAEGETHILNAARLRDKESDRIAVMAQLLRTLGVAVTERPDGLDIVGGQIRGGTVDCCGDHRIAMATAVAGCAAKENITVPSCECVGKSYAAFWEDFAALEEEER